ncbi:hypothetical protein SCLCIDRAFT_1098160 [Scleroderma citrinum Foug A]|uniref:Uncharacterized protein n=1 Tax=Scleroderma citrinum Foug A TaxID=1036808 RepID=A0A0C3DC33_9AGAM|nr:hypothetical protein SCLCIDRAFT_1098160 [Scleroderma citrinum Foug A]
MGLLGNLLSQPTPASPPRPPPPQPNPTHFYASLSELEELRHETDKIRKEFAELRALVQTPLDPPSQTVVRAESPVNPLPSPVPSITPIQSCTAHPDHPWLQAILELPDCPPLLHNVNSGMVPIFSKHMPESIQQAIRVIPVGSHRYYLGFDTNGDLQVAAQAPRKLVTTPVYIPATKSDQVAPPTFP